MNDMNLFSEKKAIDAGEDARQPFDDHDALRTRAGQVRRSSLWAAYGDALGWISELTDQKGLKRRTGGRELSRIMQWKRRIGGRSGVTVLLPEGCYSDDTQLRLATGRAIRPDGFDVEAFAKVELPVWLSYELGGGKGTKAAAMNLAKPRVAWYANTFKGWTKSGGNGAAMRIQPHVWAASTPHKPESFLVDVVRNTICTHSHPTGLMGAVLHAISLAQTMVSGRCPSPEDLLVATDIAANIPEIIREDAETGDYWRVQFERETGSLFSESWSQAILECRDAIRSASENPSGMTGAGCYDKIIDRLRLRDPDRRGSGMLTAVAAVALTWCEPQPEEALRIAANAIGTDTDTIATMAGAVLGLTSEKNPPLKVLDAKMIDYEASRLARIAVGRANAQDRYSYPDLLYWKPPKTRADALVRSSDGSLEVFGLGQARPKEDPVMGPGGAFMWQWVKLEGRSALGLTLLIKRRKNLAHIVEKWGVPSVVSVSESAIKNKNDDATGPDKNMYKTKNIHRSERKYLNKDASVSSEYSLDLQRALDYVSQHIDDDKAIGASLRKIVDKGSKSQVASFVLSLIEYIEDNNKEKGHKSKSPKAKSSVSYPKRTYEDTQILADRGGAD